jgi:hypothetical protein
MSPVATAIVSVIGGCLVIAIFMFVAEGLLDAGRALYLRIRQAWRRRGGRRLG